MTIALELITILGTMVFLKAVHMLDRSAPGVYLNGVELVHRMFVPYEEVEGTLAQHRPPAPPDGPDVNET